MINHKQIWVNYQTIFGMLIIGINGNKRLGGFVCY
jgi:hypothetical protein